MVLCATINGMGLEIYTTKTRRMYKMIDKYDIRFMIHSLQDAESGELYTMRPLLKQLKEVLDSILSRKQIHLNIKVVNGWDYVYANYDGGTEYLGKHLVNFDRRTAKENLTRPQIWDFILTGRKLHEASFNRPETVWTYRFNQEEMEVFYGERLNGRLECPQEVKYDRVAYETAIVKYQDRYECLYSQVAELAQIDRLAGIRRLERLQESGYEILPLKV